MKWQNIGKKMDDDARRWLMMLEIMLLANEPATNLKNKTFFLENFH